MATRKGPRGSVDRVRVSYNPYENRKAKRKRKEREKIDKLARKYEGVPEDEIERWVSEDFDDMDARDIESEHFCERLSQSSEVPVKVTGSRWYHSDRRIGRIWKSIHESNISNNTTTVLIFRNGDKNVYRLSIESSQEIWLLQECVRKGYVLSKIKVSYRDKADEPF